MATSPSAAAENQWDFIVVGGGLAGSVVASRLQSSDSTRKILIVEAGDYANDREDIIWPNSKNLEGGDFDWKDTTISQQHLNGRVLPYPLGKGLGGGTLINQGGWIRGDAFDYDLWSSMVNDPRWSYKGQLPYFRKTEKFWSQAVNPDQHGLNGPISIQSISTTNREFPLRTKTLQSWAEIGVHALPGLDANAGNPLGVGELQENKENGRRVIPAAKYPLDQVSLLFNATVAKILVKSQDSCSRTAFGVQLQDGTRIHGKEIILSAGAIRSPQLLLLSGIGPKDELAKFNIPLVLEQPDVGQNFGDHGLFTFGFKIRNPSLGWALGSPNPLFANKQYGWGTPADFVVSTDVPKEGLITAITKDEGEIPDPSIHPLLANKRTFHEHIVISAGAPDGSLISISSFTLLTTSRGSVRLASDNITDRPLINPNYLATNVDRYVAREAVRTHLKFAASNATILGREILDGEAGSAGFKDALSTASTDDEIDARIRAAIGTGYHPMGSVAMGKVIDTDLKFKGIRGLRVVDASVFPVIISAHLQVATYALAEQAAEIIHKEAVC